MRLPRRSPGRTVSGFECFFPDLFVGEFMNNLDDDLNFSKKLKLWANIADL